MPDHLLAGIGQVESGRRDPATGRWAPWPWTIDVGGQGTFFDTKAEAVAAVRLLQAQGVQSIDVGCVQINLMHHPDAFRTLDDAFDPQINTSYGAHFLSRLHAATGDWGKATALYHSATPDLGADYQRKVMAALSGKPLPFEPPRPDPLRQLAAAWGATLDPRQGSAEGITISLARPAAHEAQFLTLAQRIRPRGVSAKAARLAWARASYE